MGTVGAATLRQRENRRSAKPGSAHEQKERNLGLRLPGDHGLKLGDIGGSGHGAEVMPMAFGGETRELDGVADRWFLRKRRRNSPMADCAQIGKRPELKLNRTGSILHQN